MTTRAISGSADAPCGDDRVMWELWLARLHLPAVSVADELGLFGKLAAQPATHQAIAEALGISRSGAEALLSVLAGLGFLRVVADRFHITTTARDFLLPDSPYYWGGVLEAYRAEPTRHTPAAVLQALKGDPAADRARASTEWDAGKLAPERARLITRYMHAHSMVSAVGFARSADFAGVHHLLDVGAGSGCFSLAVARRHPSIRCTMMDLPEVCVEAAALADAQGLADRVGVHPANFFRDAWPTGPDAILFSNILHDWEAARCDELLRRAAAALPPGGRVFVHEMLLGDTPGGDLPAAGFSLQMAVGTLGKQPTAAELTAMLTRAGFAEIRFVNSSAHFWSAQANKP
jgi:hypothetical protein